MEDATELPPRLVAEVDQLEAMAERAEELGVIDAVAQRMAQANDAVVFEGIVARFDE